MGDRLGARAVRLALRGGAGLGLLAVLACASPPHAGVTHVVRPGETIYRISRYYGVHAEDVIRANRIDDVTEVPIGKALWIPGAANSPPPGSLAVPASVPPASDADARSLALRETELRFVWPLRGRVSSGFGRRSGRLHEGIDIPARRGTPIRAAESGRVIHSGTGLGAYGNVVIVKHSGRYSTVYAHNRSNRVRKGEFVEKGQVIGEVGKSGNANGPHLHFEIRRDRRAQDPLAYLP